MIWFCLGRMSGRATHDRGLVALAPLALLLAGCPGDGETNMAPGSTGASSTGGETDDPAGSTTASDPDGTTAGQEDPSTDEGGSGGQGVECPPSGPRAFSIPVFNLEFEPLGDFFFEDFSFSTTCEPQPSLFDAEGTELQLMCMPFDRTVPPDPVLVELRVRYLEVELGPGTVELSYAFLMNSDPIGAGHDSERLLTIERDGQVLVMELENRASSLSEVGAQRVVDDLACEQDGDCGYLQGIRGTLPTGETADVFDGTAVGVDGGAVLATATGFDGHPCPGEGIPEFVPNTFYATAVDQSVIVPR